jgi:hypothetical protein
VRYASQAFSNKGWLQARIAIPSLHGFPASANRSDSHLTLRTVGHFCELKGVTITRCTSSQSDILLASEEEKRYPVYVIKSTPFLSLRDGLFKEAML